MQLLTILDKNLPFLYTYTRDLVLMVALTHSNSSYRNVSLEGVTWMQRLHVSGSVEIQGVSDGFVTLGFKTSIPSLLFLFCTVAPVPQDLLVNYTWALLFNMGWKHTWVPSIKHFLCFPVLYSNEWSGGVHVCVSFRKREELFISSLFRSFSLPPDPHVQQLWGKCRIAN